MFATFHLIHMRLCGGHTACNLFLGPEGIKETHNTERALQEQGIFSRTIHFRQIIHPVWSTSWNIPLGIRVPRLLCARSFLRIRCVHNTPRTVFTTFPFAQCPASIRFVHHVVALSITARVSFRNALKDHSCRDSHSCATPLTEIPPMTLFSSFHCFAIHAGALKSQGTSSCWWSGDPVRHTG